MLVILQLIYWRPDIKSSLLITYKTQISVLDAIHEITVKSPIFRKGDVRDQIFIKSILQKFQITKLLFSISASV